MVVAENIHDYKAYSWKNYESMIIFNKVSVGEKNLSQKIKKKKKGNKRLTCKSQMKILTD